MKQVHCPICTGKANIVDRDVIKGTVGEETVTYIRMFLECPTCPDHLGTVLDVPNTEEWS